MRVQSTLQRRINEYLLFSLSDISSVRYFFPSIVTTWVPPQSEWHLLLYLQSV